jgi:ElaB/YqjD/DUF883 family membrane-anchored ribosome-binding protein
MTLPRDPDAARARARAARDQLMATLGTVQERLRPANLAQDAVDTARQGMASAAREGARAVRRRPWLTAAAAGGAGLLLARGWIVSIARGRRTTNETASPANGLDGQPDDISKG